MKYGEMNANDIVFMFPGVGSQYYGMGKDLYTNFKVAKETFDQASDIMNLDFTKLCFGEEKDGRLQQLKYSKLSVLCQSVATYRILAEEIGIKPTFSMGYSLGEYSALCCADVIEFSDALKLVSERARIISDISLKVNGTMAWVVNLNYERVNEICVKMNKNGKSVYISAIDSPQKCSISLTNDLLETMANKIEEMGGMLIPIKMSGPFHSEIMKSASEQLKHELLKYDFRASKHEVIANINALPYNNANVVSNLAQQIVEPVQWVKSIDYVLNKGTKIAIEVGPKTVLKYILETNTNKIKVHNTDNIKMLDDIKENLILKNTEYIFFLGRCLMSVASTKNYNYNSEEYEKKALPQYNKLKSMYSNSKSKKSVIKDEDIKRALNLVVLILKLKGMERGEIQCEINKILNSKVIVF